MQHRKAFWRRRPIATFFAILVLGTLVAVFAGLNSPDSIPAGSTQSQFKDIVATVLKKGTTVCVINDNDWMWPATRLQINDKFSLIAKDDWPPHEDRCYAMSQFTESDGTRFNVYATKIMKFDITVTTRTWPWGDVVGVWTGYW